MTQYWGDTRHFFLLNLYNFKNIGGARAPLPPLLLGPCFCTLRAASLGSGVTSDKGGRGGRGGRVPREEKEKDTLPPCIPRSLLILRRLSTNQTK